ncbi:uncharacterized protein LOC141723934 isoform X2 [Apium graveolens]|uniref:uncharacterized protein LOC141723934 isoform X2 n=1 Tax=Apium graveolens TaxID=4045 RepID=UPI003D796A3D
MRRRSQNLEPVFRASLSTYDDSDTCFGIEQQDSNGGLTGADAIKFFSVSNLPVHISNSWFLWHKLDSPLTSDLLNSEGSD